MTEFKPPARRAMAVLDIPEPDSVPVPKRRVSRRIQDAMNAMVSGDCKNITEAAYKVGMERESLEPRACQAARHRTVAIEGAETAGRRGCQGWRREGRITRQR
jgi:hypothetical protein